MTFLTGVHGLRDRFRHDARSVDERVSLTAVVEAIADIMGDVNRGGVVDRALASRIGGEVQVAVAAAVGTGRISSTTQLVGQQAFWNIVSQHLASTSSAYTDQQARQNLLQYVRNNANRTGADFANFVAQFRRGGGYADHGDRDGGATLTSARFDGFSGADAAFLSAMRRQAIDMGLHWAADRPEILRLGREALELFARTGFTRQSHDRMHAAGFNHHHMLNLVRYAERTGQDANQVAGVTADSVRIFGNGNPDEERRWREMIDAYHAAPPGDTAARDRLVGALTHMRREGTPDQQNQAETHLNLVQQADQALATANTTTLRADTATTVHAVAQQQTDAIADDLNGPPTVRRPDPPPPTQHVAGPR